MGAMMGRFSRDERAATAIEYALLAGLIGLVVIVGLGAAFTSIDNKFNVVSNTISAH